MKNLRKLSLSGNLIENIPGDTFDDLAKVQEIDLSNNKLKNLQANQFKNNQKLEFVNLNHNVIQSSDLQNLKSISIERLDLSYNMMNILSDNAFDGMENLVSISLDANELTNFHINTFSKNIRLEKISAERNQIEALPVGFLRSNKKLVFLGLGDNVIAEVSCTFQNRGIYDLLGNVCIKKKFDSSKYSNTSELNQMIDELRRVCARK